MFLDVQLFLEVQQGFCMMTIRVSGTCLTSDWTLHVNLDKQTELEEGKIVWQNPQMRNSSATSLNSFLKMGNCMS
jgi:hypothetical protein